MSTFAHTLGGMCRPMTCASCGKASWAGCGAHVEQVLGDVPQSDRCQCDRNAMKKPGILSRLRGR